MNTKPLKTVSSFGIQVLIILLIVGVLLESFVVFSLAYPEKTFLPVDLMRYLYNRFDRNVIQIMPECARYDSTLTYTLKPGECVFENREFSNKYLINRMGLRDDEKSLEKPEIVALGDSFTMGWGVEQDEAFPQVIESLTGKKVLNAGISSYGTVREIRLLEKLDLSGAEFLIIQYTDNDIRENKTLYNEKNFKILSKEKYLSTVENQKNQINYYPGKYAFNVLVQLQSRLRQLLTTSTEVDVKGKDDSIQNEVKYFLNALITSKVDLSKLKIIIFDISANRNKSEFKDEFTRQLDENEDIPDWLRQAQVVNIKSLLNESLYYILDDHPRPAGHQAIAKELVKYIK